MLSNALYEKEFFKQQEREFIVILQFDTKYSYPKYKLDDFISSYTEEEFLKIIYELKEIKKYVGKPAEFNEKFLKTNKSTYFLNKYKMNVEYPNTYDPDYESNDPLYTLYKLEIRLRDIDGKIYSINI